MVMTDETAITTIAGEPVPYTTDGQPRSTEPTTAPPPEETTTEVPATITELPSSAEFVL